MAKQPTARRALYSLQLWYTGDQHVFLSKGCQLERAGESRWYLPLISNGTWAWAEPVLWFGNASLVLVNYTCKMHAGSTIWVPNNSYQNSEGESLMCILVSPLSFLPVTWCFFSGKHSPNDAKGLKKATNENGKKYPVKQFLIQ